MPVRVPMGRAMIQMASGGAMIQMASVFGEQERQIIRSRFLPASTVCASKGRSSVAREGIAEDRGRHQEASECRQWLTQGGGTGRRRERHCAARKAGNGRAVGRDGLIYTPARPSGATGRCQQDTVSLNCPGPPPLAKVGSAPNSRLSATTYGRERMAGNVFRASAISAPVAICNTLMTRPRFGCP